MSRQPACSVIIPTYNRLELLRLTLESLTRQDLGTGAFEVLVVDDGSSEPTAEVIAAFERRLRVRYFYQPDEGFRAAAARNVGIAHATADVCVFVDSGVLLHSQSLSAHIRSHSGDAPVAVIGYLYCFNHDNEDAAEMLATLDFRAVDGTIARLHEQGRWLDARERFYARHRDALDDLPAPWVMFWAGNVSASTAQLRSIGGFDESFRCWGGEDVDLGYRLHRDGARFVLNRDARGLHHPHEKSHEANSEVQRDNLRYIADKYDTPISRLLKIDPPLSFYTINDYICEHGVPTCAEYLGRVTTGD